MRAGPPASSCECRGWRGHSGFARRAHSRSSPRGPNGHRAPTPRRRFRYRGLLGARNWELIQPFQRVFPTSTQSPSRLVTVNCVPLGAVPRMGAFSEGADLMFTPGRCKKTGSTPGATWGETSAVCGVGTSGEGTTDAPRDDSGAVVASCTGVSDDDSTLVRDDGSGTLAAAWTGVSDDDCTAIGADPAGTFAPGEAKKKYVSPAKPNVAMIAVPAISFRRDPNVSDGLFGSEGWKGSSPPITGRMVSTRRRTCPAAVVSFGARRGARRSTGGSSVPSAKLFPLGRMLGRTSVVSTVMLPPPSPAVSPFAAGAPH